MPRRRKAPRLYLRRSRNDRGAQWYILDGPVARSTSCGELDIGGAQKALAEYIAKKFTPPGALAAYELFVDEVMATYLSEHAAHSRSREFLVHTARPIMEWRRGKMLAEVRGPDCRAYVG